MFDTNHLQNYYYFLWISIYLTKGAALAIRLWYNVDTTANENRLRRKTIQINACTQEKIIEFLSILHHNESSDISTGWALRTLQSMDNYSPELNLWASQRAGERASLYWRLKRTVLVEASVTTTTHINLLLVSFVEHGTQETLHYQIKELMQTPISVVFTAQGEDVLVCLCEIE